MIRDLTPQEKQDLSDAISILEEVYGNPINPEVYAEKHFGNPYRNSMPLSVSREEKDAAGVAGFIGMRMITDGRGIPVSQQMDVAVSEKYRGKGHFSRAVRGFEENCKDRGFIIGLPNKSSFPRLQTMGYTEVIWLCHYMYAVAPFSFILGSNFLAGALDKLFENLLWMKKAKVRDGEDLTLSEGMDEIPVSDSELEEISRDQTCHFLHDKKIYSWKQSYNPDLHFYWATVREKDGSLMGYALCHLRPRLRGNFVIIDDYAVSPKDRHKKHTLRLLFSRLADLGNILEVPFVNVQKDGGRLKSMHFVNACRFPFPLRGGPLIVSSDCDLIEAVRNCSFRNIDSDVL